MAKVQNITTGEVKEVSDSNGVLQGFAEKGFVPVNNKTPITPAKINTQVQDTKTTKKGPSVTSNFDPNAEPNVVSGQDVQDIRAKEAADRELRRLTAETLFGPRIEAANKLGRAQVSTGEGVTGQRAGFNISTAEAQFIKSIEDQAAQRVKEIETQKANFIATGDFESASRADTEIRNLQARQDRIFQAKQDRAIQLMQVGLQERGVDLQEQSVAAKIATDMANLTGTLADGSPTFQAQQSAINNALNIAGLTGEFNGAPTFAARRAIVEDAFTQAGIDIQQQSLEESIRSNKAQESLQRQRNAISSSKAQATKFLTRDKLNQLNTVGLDDDTSNFIAETLSFKDKESAIDDLARVLPGMKGMSADPTFFRDEAAQLIDKYINEVNKLTLDEQIANLLGGGNTGLNVQDTTFEELGK